MVYYFFSRMRPRPSRGLSLPGFTTTQHELNLASPRRYCTHRDRHQQYALEHNHSASQHGRLKVWTLIAKRVFVFQSFTRIFVLCVYRPGSVRPGTRQRQ